MSPIVENMVENRLRLFRHIERKPTNFLVKRVVKSLDTDEDLEKL